MIFPTCISFRFQLHSSASRIPAHTCLQESELQKQARHLSVWRTSSNNWSETHTTTVNRTEIREMGSVGGDRNVKVAPHVVVIPITPQGHLSPLLRLATRIAGRGITVSFVSSEDAISRLNSAAGRDGESSSELRGLDFRFVALPFRTEGPGTDKDTPFMSILYEEAFKALREKWIHDKSAGIAGVPTSIISDMFLAWTQEMADDLQIPRYMFVPSGVIMARAMQGYQVYYESGQFQISETDGMVVPFDWAVRIPGIPPLRYHETPHGFDEPLRWGRRMETVGQSAGLLVNSFFELEEKVIDTWRRVGNPGFEHIKVPKIYPVGPLFSTSVPNIKAPPAGLEDSASECLLWLGSQPSSSVLYVAFGSHCRLGPEHVHELALGLEESKQRFLWVIPQLKDSSELETPSSISDVLPPGFLARVGDRGCVVTGWAPQLQILAHSATGGFLTHSGWNSSLESIILGVPMISWPQNAEQHLNCRYLVDDLRIAEQLQTGPENILKRNEVERVVRLLMIESEGKAIRSRVEELQRKAAAAAAEGGSQSRIFKEFLDDVRKHGASPYSER